MKVLYLTHSVIGDRSYGGPMRGNGLRDALLAHAAVDTLVIHSADRLSLPLTWGADRSRTATLTETGWSRGALRQRRALRSWVAGIIRDGGYDVLVAQFLELARLVPRRERRRLVYDPDDFLKALPPGAAPWSPSVVKLRLRNALAVRMARQAGHVFYVNPDPAQLPPTPRRSHLPNVVGFPDPGRDRGRPIPGRLLMVGHLLHRPNVDGLAWFHREVLPALRAADPTRELHVVGRHEPGLPERFPDVVFHGFVDSVTPHYDCASLVVAPIRSGGGSQIKVVDALAHGRPLVSSDFAAAGFAGELRAGEDLLVASTPQDWVDACERLLADAPFAEQLGRNGEATVRRSFGHQRMAEEVGRTLARFGAPADTPATPTDA